MRRGKEGHSFTDREKQKQRGTKNRDLQRKNKVFFLNKENGILITP